MNGIVRSRRLLVAIPPIHLANAYRGANAMTIVSVALSAEYSGVIAVDTFN
jgi:hypothetical protein